MKFILDKDKLDIENKIIYNSGSVLYYEADVEYDESWNGLTIEAVIIKKGEEEGVSRSIINNKIYLDKEMSGSYSIGFVGYTIENNEKNYQISTNLKPIIIRKGAGEIETNNEDIPTPTEWEIYIAQIQEMIDNIEDMDITAEKIGKQTTITITKKDGTIQEVVINDGQDGKDGKDGVDGKDAKINGKKSIEIEAGNNITIDDTENGIRINSTGGGSGGTSNYNDLSNKPKINNVELSGNKSLNDLGIQPKGNYLTTETDPTVPSYVKSITQSNITSWNNKSNFSGNYNDLSNKPTIPDELKDLSDDSTHRTVTDIEKTTWNNKQNAISDLSTIRSGASAGATAVQPSDLATVATSGSYNDLSNKPSEVTESTVSGWGFTKNTGTYSKPSGGIPKTDLASGVQTSLGKADTALQSHQDISGKANKISVVQTSASTIEINPNTFYKFGEVASLNITLASITDNTIYNEYMFEFVSGTTATTLTLPSSIKWLETPTIDANKIYQCSIVDNVGLLVGVANV